MSQPCCPSDSLGPAPRSTIAPKGKIVQLSTESANIKPLSAYIVGKEEGASRAVIVFCDVFGIESGSHKLVCDELASRLDDTLVIMPDLFRGCPLVGGWGLPMFITMPMIVFSIVYGVRTYMSPANIDRDLASLVRPYLDSKLSADAEVSCVGFCFGGWVVGRALTLKSLNCSKGVAIHAAPQVELLAGGSVTGLWERVGEKPVLFLPARSDSDTKVDSPIVKQLAEQRNVKPDEICVDFPDMIHGWVTRGDLANEQVAQNFEKVMSLTTSFIQTANI
ncbi:dienelactone hydrolase-like protein [Fragilaria crotonensis]|nr:dienelactone hydrolase-like protein [Fragilaria crotonensis]